jgi:hypothetical protein
MGATAEEWRGAIRDYLDTSDELSGREQLVFTRVLLREFGFEVPQLGPRQEDELDKNAAEYPRWRLMPTALGDIALRRRYAQPNENSALNDLMKGPDASGEMRDQSRLWLPCDGPQTDKETKEFDELWTPHVGYITNSDEMFAHADGRNLSDSRVQAYALRYRTANNDKYDRKSFKAWLYEDTNNAVADNGLIWTFPLMDVSQPEREDEPEVPLRLFNSLNYIVTPETVLGMQVLKLLAGQPISQNIFQISNEVMVELTVGDLTEIENKIRGYVSISRNTGVWADGKMAFMQSWHTSLEHHNWHLPMGISGLYPVDQVVFGV